MDFLYFLALEEIIFSSSARKFYSKNTLLKNFLEITVFIAPEFCVKPFKRPDIFFIGKKLDASILAHHLNFLINQTFRSVQYVDFFSGFIKTFFFAIIIGWICCYHGYVTREGSLGVGKFTTKAVAYSYIFVIVSNTVLTKIILTFWG